MDALKRKMEIAAVAFFCTVTALIAACSCATTAAANLAQQTAAAPATEYVTLAYMEVQPEAEQEPELLYEIHAVLGRVTEIDQFLSLIHISEPTRH